MRSINRKLSFAKEKGVVEILFKKGKIKIKKK